MIGLVKENASNISNNIVTDSVYANENSKLYGINSQSRKKERPRVPKKSKSVGDSAFRVFANNFMSLFGYGDAVVQPVGEAVIPEIPESQRRGVDRQGLGDEMGVEHSRNETVAIGTDVEDDDPTPGGGETRLAVDPTSSSVASMNFDGQLGHSGKSAAAPRFVSEKKSYSQLQIIAHVSGRPVHAKYSYGKNKFKMAHMGAERQDSKHPSGSEQEAGPGAGAGSVSNPPNVGSVFVPSPVMQFRQVPVQMVPQKHPIVYNTPLITQRIIPQTKKIIYQPVYAHGQVEMGSNGSAGPMGHGLVHRNVYPQETFIGAGLMFAGKELPGVLYPAGGVLSAMPNNAGSYVGSNQMVGLGTPLAGYRSMSHVPSNVFIKMDSNQSSVGTELLDVSRETRLQSSNEVAVSGSAGHIRSGTGGSVASTGSVGQSASSFGHGGAPTMREGLVSDCQSSQGPSKRVVRTGNGSLHTLSLTTTSSSDTGSVAASNGSVNTKMALDSSSSKDVAKSSGREETDVLEKGTKREEHDDVQKGFIPQASPVVNYRSTLDYLVTPMVRYRDIASNLKIRTVPPQLSSNDACKYATAAEAPGNGSVPGAGAGSSSNGSNSPRNTNVMGSNEYKETVYTPVAPFPSISNYPAVAPGLGEMVSSNVQPGGGPTVVPGVGSAEHSVLRHTPPAFGGAQGSSSSVNGVVFPGGGSQSGRVLDGGLKSQVYRVPVGVPQNLGYRLVRTAVKSQVGVCRGVVVGSSVHKENVTREENLGGVRNSNARRGYVNKMYKYLADSSQFPPLPKEIYVDDIEFLTRPISSDPVAYKDGKRFSVGARSGETNVSLVKGLSPGKGREWDSINRGTFCTVYKVSHGECVAAVKCPQKRIHDSDPLMSRYRCYTEWKLLYRCNRHPNILNLIGGIRINEYEIWLVTEYIKTGDLFKLIHGNGSRSKAFRESVEYRYKVMYQLADSIRFLHSLSPKIVHKDLKSNNILIDENYNIRICDFGDAEELHYNVITCCTAVTWQYAPPEIVGCSDPARPNSNANEKVDVWSMGCIFLEILCKRTPLQHILDKVDESCKHSTLYNLIHSNKIEGELKIPPLPDSLYNLITMCLRPNPELRASSREVFDYLVNNEKKILMQLGYINQYKLSGHSNLSNPSVLSQLRAAI